MATPSMREVKKSQGENALPITPFLKWAGGKRWLAPFILEKLKRIEGSYIEPFLGGGAIFFYLRPNKAILNDVNKNLIETYKAISTDHGLVTQYLKEHQTNHSRNYYYKIREYNPRCAFRKAARFIYLNRTCWNGLYRVNFNGKFNVPIGTKDTVLLKTDDWPRISDALKKSTLLSEDFEEVIKHAKRGDVVFADPPYTVRHNLNGFIKYNESLFSWEDQERLSESLIKAAGRGAHIISTNANHKSLRTLYKDKFKLITLSRSTILSSSSEFRGKTQELLVLSENL